MTPTERKTLFQKKLYIYFDAKTNNLRLSETDKKNPQEIVFAVHPAVYEEKDFEKIIAAFQAQKVRLPNGEILESRYFTKEKPAGAMEILTSYANQNLKNEIFALKRTHESRYFALIKKEPILVPAKITNKGMDFYRKKYSFNEKEISFIITFSNTDEFKQFQQTEKDEKLKDYKLLISEISRLKKKISEKEGIYINPAADNICGKDFSFAFTFDFLSKY